MDDKEFEKGIVLIETAKSKKYSGPQQESLLKALYEDFKGLTGGSWLDICDALRLSPKAELPVLGQFWEVRRQLPNLQYETGGRTVCGNCRKGIRYWLGGKLEEDGDTIRCYVARCDCLAGQKWTGLPTMAAVEKRDDFQGWINRGIPEEVAAEARKKREGADHAPAR